ncbi:MAG: ImmA/IrrE family metallo-endopeptidase [Stenotrophomonas maltophilia]|uniref:ImmA/IrrE family metallo-endopeptidase n=1 Tax=Stenotrophomonas maltophilia group TaxID=995085 RepID=UPI00131382DB|nr:ImmA/IrrE family metallo-endopeptidase [Stenotrophomonas maltophilia]MBS4800615.1 ImmA/IrrE family metallo-endopeptidase [Stenotrophomonas maltophilia]MCF3537027.1 ImmA/IrrE family metallo-endopeptidase [Stenotrophomonas maltophilia]
MRGEPVVGIQPSVMRWARESAGMSVDDVATRLKRQLAEVESWESGDGAPTYPQLERLAYELYKRPLAVFFLPEPPQEVSPRQQFRTLPAEELASLSRDTYLHLRKARAYQVGLEDLYSETNPAPRKIWHHVSLQRNQDVAAQAMNIRRELGIDSPTQAQWGGDDQALKAWRSAIERTGVFVFKDSFKQKTISGFCLRDHEFPLIYINNSTTKTRQIFSLLHELAHILFDVSGISKFDTSYIRELPVREQELEVFCNAVAAEVLIPFDEFSRVTAGVPSNVDALDDAYFSGVARHFGVSREAILRRFLDAGRATRSFYESKAREWTDQMVERDGGGGSWYASKGAYLSDTLLQEVFARRLRGQLSSERAAEYLGVKPANLPGLEDLVLHRTRN